MDLTILLASILAAAAPVVLAAVGETITEKSGVINLSLDGTILLSAMGAFSVAYETKNVPVGFLAAGAVGGLVAALIGFSVFF
jgi:simple sugar transport system permease protein